MFAVIHTNSKAQYRDFEARLSAKQDSIDAIVTGYNTCARLN
jgi:hypothetical protein